MHYFTYLFKRLFWELWVNFRPGTGKQKISVIIPTIWRSSLIGQLVERLSACEQVGEIILIDNKGENGRDLAALSKVRVHNAETNLFVNPSWNLGVSLAKHDAVAICNDDILFDVDTLLRPVCNMLGIKAVGIIGIDKSCLQRKGKNNLWVRYVADRAFPFGILMFMRKDHYTPIPDALKIYSGDNYLFEYMKGPHFAIKGIRIHTLMSSSSGSEEFRDIKMKDVELYQALYRKGAEK